MMRQRLSMQYKSPSKMWGSSVTLQLYTMSKRLFNSRGQTCMQALRTGRVLAHRVPFSNIHDWSTLVNHVNGLHLIRGSSLYHVFTMAKLVFAALSGSTAWAKNWGWMQPLDIRLPKRKQRDSEASRESWNKMPRSQGRGCHGQSRYLRLSFVHQPGAVQEDNSQGGEMTKKVVRGCS